MYKIRNYIADWLERLARALRVKPTKLPAIHRPLEGYAGWHVRTEDWSSDAEQYGVGVERKDPRSVGCAVNIKQDKNKPVLPEDGIKAALPVLTRWIADHEAANKWRTTKAGAK